VLHQGSVPHEAEEERADKNDEHEREELSECVRLGLGLGNFLNHLLDVNIFSCETVYERTTPEWFRK